MRGVILITEDERRLAPLQGALVREGHRVLVSAPDYDSLIDVVGEMTPEVLVVDCDRDIRLPAAVRKLVSNECNIKETSVVALVTDDQASEMDWAGIDDFLLYPLNANELLARLGLLFWRTKKIDADRMIKIGDLIIDLLNYEVIIGTMPVELTFKEYELLRFLASHRGRVFTRESLLNHVWGYDYYGGVRTVDVHIRRLRSKLLPPTDSLIETVRNVGYRFTA